MQHKVKVTVIDKKLYTDLQQQYCADPESGKCPCYHVGDAFVFERYGTADDFWHIGRNTLKQTACTAGNIAGGPEFPHCSEAWDAISRYIYTGLQGGSIMRGWMKDERVMIACCSDGTRPVIFKIERLDYNVLWMEGLVKPEEQKKIRQVLEQIDGVTETVFREEFAEVYLQKDVEDSILKNAAEECGSCRILRID